MKGNWQSKQWSEVLDIRSGRNQKAVIHPDGKYPIIGSAGKVMGYANEFICDEGTTIIGRKGTINSPLFITTKFWNVDTAFGLHALEELDKHFLHYFCLSFDFTELDKGSGRPSLVKRDLLNINIPIPSQTEQKHIVAILDKAFAAIDQAKANIEKNIQNAQELFQSKLNQIFSQKGEGWKEKILGEFAQFDKSKYTDGNLPYVGLEHIESNSGVYLGTKELYAVKSSTFQFDQRHVLYGRLRPYLNKVLVPDFKGHCSTEIFPILPNSSLSRMFLFYWLMTPITVSKINATWTGARMPRANMNEVLKFKLSIPKIERQEKISKNLAKLKAKTSKAIEMYESKAQNLEELKKSILQKAFAGELI